MDGTTLIGIRSIHNVDVEERYLIEQLLQAQIVDVSFLCKKVISNGIKLTSQLCQLRRSCRKDYYIVTKQKLYMKIHYFLAVETTTGERESVAVGYPIVLTERLVRNHQLVGLCCSHIREFHTRERKVVCLVKDIATKCSVIEASDYFRNSVCCVHHEIKTTT